VASLAAALLFQAVFWPKQPLVIPVQVSIGLCVLILSLVYLIGHIVQGIGNICERLPIVRKQLREKSPLSADLTKRIREAAVARFGAVAADLKIHELSQLCDQTLVHHGSFGEREIFTYREGFYRGCMVGFAFLSLALLVFALRTETALNLGDYLIKPGRIPTLLVSFLGACCAWIAFERFMRFGQHRIRSCLLRFLAFSVAAKANP